MSLRASRLAIVAVVASVAMILSGCSTTNALSAGVTSAKADPVVVAIGDSIMKGNGLSPSEAWPALIAKQNNWKLTNLACNSAGFDHKGSANDCDVNYSGLIARATALHPSLIVISGSSNDFGTDNTKLEQETDEALGELHADNPKATIVGISTVWGDTLVPDQTYDINHQVHEAVSDVGGIYLDIGQPLAGHREWLQKDDVHPTAKGQRVLAVAIAGALRSAKISL